MKHLCHEYKSNNIIKNVHQAKLRWCYGQHVCSPSGRWRQNVNGCAVIRCTRPNICVIATMLHMARDRSWMFCSKVVVVPMDRQFEVLPIMSAGDYVTHGDTLYITFNPGSAAREEQSDSFPAADSRGS